MENLLRSALEEGRFVYTAELVLGRDHAIPDAEEFVRDASQEPNGVKVMSATDLPGGTPALLPEAFMSHVLEHGLTPIAHLSGKDGNRDFMEARLHSLAHMGVESILALTGDAHKDASTGMPKPVYDLDSVLILQLVEEMRRGIGYRVGPREVQTTPFDFFSGAAAGPYKVREPDQMMQYYKLELKIASGARYIIPQLGFNMRKLYELRQYMAREGLGHIPVIANIYVPTATVAKMMQRGELSGCVVTDEFIGRLGKEKKPQRLERAALMVAAARSLGFNGAHIGGFGLKHKDFMTIIDRSHEIDEEWRDRIEEIIFEYPGEFHLFPRGSDGLSDGEAPYQLSTTKRRPGLPQRLGHVAHRLLIDRESLGGRFFASRLGVRDAVPEGDSWRGGLWYRLLGLSHLYRRPFLGCVMCGDCIVDHLNYASCPMGRCYKELRNGPCGGSRVDGTCEADDQQTCVWDLAYESTLAAAEDPKKFASTLLPPRDWALDQKSPLANRLADIDNYPSRKAIEVGEERHDDQQGTVPGGN